MPSPSIKELQTAIKHFGPKDKEALLLDISETATKLHDWAKVALVTSPEDGDTWRKQLRF